MSAPLESLSLAPLTLPALASASLDPSPRSGPAADLASASLVQDPLPAAPPGTGEKGDGAATGGGGGFNAFIPFLVIGAVFWFLIIGPERKNRKKREQMLVALKKGDKVMTTGGLYGRVSELRDDTVILDTGDVRLKFARAAIQGLVDGDEAKDLKETKT
jgi:preprotein translocase subunit YajC